MKPKNDLPLMDTKEGIVLFHPHVPAGASERVAEVLKTRWIGQGPKVDEFESRFRKQLNQEGHCVAVGSGTDALHLAYLLAGIGPGDEVLTPVFTCTATNIPLLYIGAKPVFVDVDPLTLNVSVKDMKAKISEKTKAIVVVHYGGLPCDMDEITALAKQYNIPVIEDAAHALGAKYGGVAVGNLSDFTMYSFQAIKHITTGDGGMLTFKDSSLIEKAKRLRWFGIDRTSKQKGIWENDIKEVGYKYQMTDVAAAMGLAALDELNTVLDHRRNLYLQYFNSLSGMVQIADDRDPSKEHAAWLFTIIVGDREALQRKLRENHIESGQVHYRNDRYSIFGCKDQFPGMDAVDDGYLVLPLHTRMTEDDVDRICRVIWSGW